MSESLRKTVLKDVHSEETRVTAGFTDSHGWGIDPAGGGSQPQSATITGLLLGVIFGLLFIIAGCVAIWIVAARRNRQEAEEDAGADYETEVESRGEFTFEVEDQLDSCDGGTTFGQDENEFLDQGFEVSLFGNAVEEAQFQF
jgi:hypothetical protein